MKYSVGSDTDCVHLTAVQTSPPLVNEGKVPEILLIVKGKSGGGRKCGHYKKIRNQYDSCTHWTETGMTCYFRKKIMGKKNF